MQTLSLTNNQKRVLAKIASSPTPKVAAEEISRDQNLIAARDQLAKLDVISYFNNEAKLTEKGEQIAKEEGITDETGQLSPDGQHLASTNPEGEHDVETSGGEQHPELSGAMGAFGGQAGPQPGIMPGLESVHYEPMVLLKELLEW